MPVFNGERFISASIRSILEQTFGDLELVIVDDGSTDGTCDVIAGFNDPRLVVHHQPNQGIAQALNTGITLARAPLIARHDHDDIALPERLWQQVEYLSLHPEVGLLGTWARKIDLQGAPIGVLEHPTQHEAIAYYLHFDSVFVHPSVVYRKAIFEQAGPYRNVPLEDLDLWQRMIHITRAANLPRHLLLYRVVPGSLSHATTARNRDLMELRRRYFEDQHSQITGRQLELISSFGIGHPLVTSKELRELHARLILLIRSIVHDVELRERLVTRLSMELMSYRLMPHSTFFHRLFDKLLKLSILRSASRT
jgi:glycosyltransferase involved in cell wall biosynthesis